MHLPKLRPERCLSCAGIVSAPRTDFNPVMTDQPAQHPPSQRGAFGGRAAVAKLFGLADAGELPTIEESLSRSSTLGSELDPADVLSAGVDSLMHDCAGSSAESAVTGPARLTIRIPVSTAGQRERQTLQQSVTEDVSHDVEDLLMASLDSMLFGADDSTLNEVSIPETALPAFYTCNIHLQPCLRNQCMYLRKVRS